MPGITITDEGVTQYFGIVNIPKLLRLQCSENAKHINLDKVFENLSDERKKEIEVDRYVSVLSTDSHVALNDVRLTNDEIFSGLE